MLCLFFPYFFFCNGVSVSWTHIFLVYFLVLVENLPGKGCVGGKCLRLCWSENILVLLDWY